MRVRVLMMRWRRGVRRVLVGLVLLCMMVKIQLELRLLDAAGGTGTYAPWWSNETLGHIRVFPKDGPLPNLLKVQAPLAYTNGSISQLHKKLSLNATMHAQDLEAKNNAVISGGKVLTRSNGSDIFDSKLNEVQVNKSIKLTNNDVSRKIVHKITVKKNSSVLNSSVGKTTSKNNLYGKEATQRNLTRSSVKRNLFSKLILSKDGKVVKSTNTDKIQENDTGKSSQLVSDKGKESDVLSDKKNQNMKGNAQKENTPKNKNVASAEVETKPLQREALSIAKVKFPAGAKPKSKGGGRRAQSQRGVSHEVDSKEVSLTKEEIAGIKKQVAKENERQTVYNLERYGPVVKNTTIFLVQVHKRLVNLRYLVDSMKSVRGIEEALVVFSHDFWDPAMNAFVRNITEFRVMQIFFPFSIQLHPFVFPGRDPRDCTWNVNRRDKLTCLNKDWPDSYGHYREAAFTQIKHHWWWKIHRVFEGLCVTEGNYSGHVVFLEEDHYLAPDLLHLLSLMQRLRPALCSDCQVLALGNYNKMNANVYRNYVERGDWWVTKYNLGFALDAAAWRVMKKCSASFCQFDDYNWDWTMTNIVQTCHKPRLPMFSARLSRVLHVGSCGTHVKKNGCDVRTEVVSAANRISSAKKWLFPTTLFLQNAKRSSGKAKKGNGGWGDYRDRQLCHAIANGTAIEATLDSLQFRDRH